MTVDTATPLATYSISGTGPYAIPWPYTAGSVRVGIGAAGIVQVLDPAYWSLTPSSTTTSGDLYLTEAAVAAYDGMKLVIERETVTEQGWAGILGEREKGLEAQLDLLVMGQQEMRDQLSGSLRLPGSVRPLLPTPGSTVIFGDDGQPRPGPTAQEISNAQSNAELAAAARAAAAISAAQAALYEGPWLDHVAALLADTTLTYAAGSPSSVAVGGLVRTRAEGYCYKVVDADPDVTTAAGVMLRVVPKSNGAVSPEQFGASGDATIDDRDALRRMLAHSCRIFEPDPEKRYRTSGQLDLGRVSKWLTKLNLRVTGSRDAAGASLGVQTGGGSQHTNLIFVQGKHSGPGFDVFVETHAAAPWLAVLGNDFYLHQDGTRPPYATQIDFDDVEIRASEWTAGYSGDGNSCLRFQGMDKIRIGRLTLANWQLGVRCHDVDDVVMGGEFARISNARNGIQFTAVPRGMVGDVIFEGNALAPEYVPGANALVIRGVRQFLCSNVVAENAGEHGIRITSNFADTEKTGNWAVDNFTSASFGHIRIVRPGGCGFKAASGDDDTAGQAPITAIQMASLYVEDAGAQDYGVGGTFTGSNHFGLNLQEVHSFMCPSYITRRINNPHNGRNFALLRRVRNLSIGDFQGTGCYGDAIFWNVGDSAYYNFVIGGGVVADYGRDGSGRMLHVFNAQYSGRVAIKLDAHNAPSLIRFAGDYNGTPLSFWRVDCTHFNVTDTNIVGNSLDRRRINVRPATTPTSSGEVNFGVGDMLICVGEPGGNSALRNGAVDVYLLSGNSGQFVAVAAGVTPATGVGLKLTGSWRQRGRNGDHSVVLVEKVAS
ncbi:hypothetical protein [Cereibacter azotoformans]|uniref:hypothetical protein n=1 Tax=Cereibacter azotoformans TaxID=43057 RepID=UPI000C6E50E0|nr:hypothetical protein [Cereibacter azotoformans]